MPEFKNLREKIAFEKKERVRRYAEFLSWIDEAHEAGLAAASNAKITPMRVIEHERMLDDNSPVKRSWDVPDGVCGFAWVIVHPANSSFAVWAKKTLGWRTAYGGGLQYWVNEFNQSMQKKEAYARAYAQVLQSHGVKAYAGSRMD